LSKHVGRRKECIAKLCREKERKHCKPMLRAGEKALPKHVERRSKKHC
jgi:hypothetical protein